MRTSAIGDALLTWTAVLSMATSAAMGAASEVDFDRDVRPILADRCYKCHGPDEAAREADLRLDLEQSVFADRGGYAAVVPGNVDQSELITRILSADADVQMPPPDSKLSLSGDEKEMLGKWVSSGAAWGKHWAFVPPTQPELPVVDGSSWPRNEIDRFVLQRLSAAGLRPGPEADKQTLVRRLYLDLQGLPPSPEETAAFASDASPSAYEKLVDRLLASDACAERLALDWLDLSRYADSHGLHADGARRMWPWRDWVISAFRRNLPYDQFVSWQIAGDMLPEPTDEQRLATAYLRNHAMTAEGGVIDEEVRLNYVFDRLESVSTGLLGLTIGCARCHDHKFDPISQREYYEMAAFFNNVRELGMTGDDGDFGPVLPLPDEQTRQKLERIDADLAKFRADRDSQRSTANAEFLRVRPDVAGELKDLPIPPATIFPLDSVLEQKVKQKVEHRLDGNSAATAAVAPEIVEGIKGKAARVTDDFGFLSFSGVGLFDVADQFSLALWIKPEPDDGGKRAARNRVLAGASGDKNQLCRGWEFFLDDGDHLDVRFIHGRPEDLIHVRTRETIGDGKWRHVAFSYDGLGKAAGVRVFIDGRPAPTETLDDKLTGSIFPVSGKVGFPHDEKRTVRAARSYRAFGGDFGIYRGALDDVQFFQEALTDLEVAALFDQYRDGSSAKFQNVSTAGHLNKPSAAESDAAFEHWLKRSHQGWQDADQAYRKALAARIKEFTATPKIMVMQEMPQPRETRILERGQYDRPRDVVECATPSAVLAWPADLPRNRLGLARWLFEPRNPLPARVAANHYWQLVFGQGIEATPQDFGMQGERPSHPELLDWLAVHFEQSGWDVRRLLKLYVMSAAYRQSSSVAEWRRAVPTAADATANQSTSSSDPLAVDPANRLLWRGPSFRLSAEAIRDRALAASGLLVRKVGGPSVKPYQPAGLWTEKSNFSQELADYVQDSGDSLYRRSMYTFIRRTSPPPMMTTFDAPDRATCTVKREATNTPLQSLVLLNDPQFVEAARVLAERVQEKASDNPESRVAAVFELLIGRGPNKAELSSLTSLFEEARMRYAKHPDSATKLLSVGETPRAKKGDPAETAALAIVANTVMSFDEFYMLR